MEFTKEQQSFQKIVHEAWENEAFKKELVNNPVEAIEKLMGEKVQLPEGKTLVVRDQTDESTIYINIPTEQNMNDIELNEEHLEAVVGGANLSLIYRFQISSNMEWGRQISRYRYKTRRISISSS